jgi:hypothetical protein
MKIGRASGVYVPFSTASIDGATGWPFSFTIGTARSLSLFSM